MFLSAKQHYMKIYGGSESITLPFFHPGTALRDAVGTHVPVDLPGMKDPLSPLLRRKIGPHSQPVRYSIAQMLHCPEPAAARE
jgi:hypothetical protein